MARNYTIFTMAGKLPTVTSLNEENYKIIHKFEPENLVLAVDMAKGTFIIFQDDNSITQFAQLVSEEQAVLQILMVRSTRISEVVGEFTEVMAQYKKGDNQIEDDILEDIDNFRPN